MKKHRILTLYILTLLLVPTLTWADTKAGIKPSSLFYFFDITSEKLSLLFTFDVEKKANKALGYAEERLQEAKEEAEDNKPKAVEEAIKNYEASISLATEKSKDIKNESEAETLLNTISSNTTKHQEVLKDIYGKVPAEAKEAILKAIKVSQEKQKEADRQIGELKKEVVELKDDIKELQEKLAIKEKSSEQKSSPTLTQKPNSESTKVAQTPPLSTSTPEIDKSLKELKEELERKLRDLEKTPAPTPTSTPIKVEIVNSSPIPIQIVSPTPTPSLVSTPTSTPTPILTPTPSATPTPTLAPTAHFLKYGIPYPEITNLPLVPAPSNWAKTSKINIELVDNSTATLVVSPTTSTVSLGKFLIHLPKDTYIDQLGIGVAFWSDNLSNRDDEFYGIHKNIFKRVYLKNNIYGEKVFPAQLSEPTDYYFKGNYYQVFNSLDLTNTNIPNTQEAKVNFSVGRLISQNTDMLFEVFLEIQCMNSDCLDYAGNSLGYLNGGILQPKVSIGYRSRNYDASNNEYTPIYVGTVTLKSDGSMDSSGVLFLGRKITFKLE